LGDRSELVGYVRVIWLESGIGLYLGVGKGMGGGVMN